MVWVLNTPDVTDEIQLLFRKQRVYYFSYLAAFYRNESEHSPEEKDSAEDPPA